MRKWRRLSAAVVLAAILLFGCGKTSREQEEFREAGIACMESGDFSGAVEQFDKAVAAAKRVSAFELDVLKYRGEAEYKLGDYEAASHTYEILTQVEGEKPEYLYLEAICLADGQDEAGAKKSLETAKKLDADGTAVGCEEAVMAVGRMYQDMDLPEEARALYEEFLSKRPERGQAYGRLALMDMKAGDYERALTYLENGLALVGQEEQKELSFQRAVCYEYLGQFEKALSCFQEYVRIYGSDEAAEHEIAFLVTR